MLAHRKGVLLIIARQWFESVVPRRSSGAARAAGRAEAETARKGTGMRVLLIEDDSATAQSIELMLKSESFNVYTTDLGEEGVDLGKLYDYDIILLDLNLPDMSGFEVLRSLACFQGQDADPDPVRPRRHRGQGQGLRLRRRRLHDQAVPQGRAGGAHPCHRAPLQGPRPVGHPDRRTRRQSRHQDRGGPVPSASISPARSTRCWNSCRCARARR